MISASGLVSYHCGYEMPKTSTAAKTDATDIQGMFNVMAMNAGAAIPTSMDTPINQSTLAL